MKNKAGRIEYDEQGPVGPWGEDTPGEFSKECS
jgi:hypothetical protein